MMKRKILAAVIPALLAAATANAAEIYNKDGNKLDLYGKAVGRHVWTTTGDSKNADQTYAQIGFKGETQINTDLTGFGQWEYRTKADRAEGDAIAILRVNAVVVLIFTLILDTERETVHQTKEVRVTVGQQTASTAGHVVISIGAAPGFAGEVGGHIGIGFNIVNDTVVTTIID